MADFIAFTEGKELIWDDGFSDADCRFALSSKGVDAGTAHTAGETLGGADFGQITGTGYANKTGVAKPASNGSAFAQQSWSTGSATDWPAVVRSVVLISGTSAIICAWNLQTGGAARDMSAANTTENVTPTLTIG